MENPKNDIVLSLLTPELVVKKDKRLDIIKKKCQFMAVVGKEYTLKSVNGSYELISNLFNAKYRNKRLKITPVELGFIRRVKNHIINNETYLLFDKQVFSGDVFYMECNRTLKGKSFENFVEIDINQAYWETAYMLGAISLEIYEEGLNIGDNANKKGKISKVGRLVALGVLAKKTHYYKFKSGRLIVDDVERSLLTENVWFNICQNVSRVMEEVVAAVGKDYMFYWVDGIYIKSDEKAIALAQSIFSANGYQTKMKDIYRAEFGEHDFSVYTTKDDYDNPIDETGNKKDGFRTFQYVDKTTYTFKKKYTEEVRLKALYYEIVSPNRKKKKIEV